MVTLTSIGRDAEPVPAPAAPSWRRAWRVAGVVLALALLFAAWQGYRNPDFLLGLATFRLC
jgi:hypothetical protein